MNKYNLEITAGQFGEDGYVSRSGWLKVYSAHWETGEYTEATMEHVTIGGGLSNGAYLDAPETLEKQGVAIIRSEDGKSWLHVTDCRGKTAYSTDTREPIEIDFIGDLPPTLTLFAPKTEFDKWSGKRWVTDTAAQKAALVEQANNEKSQRLDEANNAITYLQDSVDVGIATEEEITALTAWKTYRVYLNRVDTSTAPDIEWPVKP